jgi:VanZ family protein
MNAFFDRLDADLLIPLLIPLSSMVLAGVIVYLVLHYKNLQTEKTHDMIKYLTDRGMPVPPERLAPPERKQRQSPLIQAITLVGVGIGLGVMFYLLDQTRLIGVGALVMCIGAAQLMGLFIEGRRASRAAARADVETGSGGDAG